MSETTPDTDATATSADDIRQHSQTPAEGPDIQPEFQGTDADEPADVPREHSQDPAEG
jgi:hypothetical protein